jgi:hypothetical protein
MLFHCVEIEPQEFCEKVKDIFAINPLTAGIALRHFESITI